jgi:hypothetical protein
MRGTSTLIVSLLLGMGLALPRHAQAATCEATSYGTWYPNSPSQDSSGGLQNALTNCAGQTMHIAAGTYYFLPTTLQSGFTVPANTTITGDFDAQNNPTTILVTGTQANLKGNYDYFFRIVDVSNVTIEHIDFEGSQDWSNCPQAPQYNSMLGSFANAIGLLETSATIQGITIENNKFHNFNGTGWIDLVAAANSPGIGTGSPIEIANNVFDATGILQSNGTYAALHNCAGSGGLTWNVYQIWMQGSETTATGFVENVTVANNTFYSNYVKGAVALHGGDLQLISIQYNDIYDAGMSIVETSGSEDLGRYAIQLYSVASGLASNITNSWVVANVIVNPVSCGLYLATASNIEISYNSVSGQTDSYDAVLPKGGIALGGLINPNPLPSGSLYQVYDNDLTDNLFGIEVSGGTGTFDANTIINVPENGVGMKIALENVSAPEAPSLAFSNTTVSTTVTDSSTSSVIGYSNKAFASGCTKTAILSSGTLSINGLKQIGWSSPTSRPASIQWFDDSRNCGYHGFDPGGPSPYLEPATGLITNVTRQATATSTPVAQTAFWPYTN